MHENTDFDIAQLSKPVTGLIRSRLHSSCIKLCYAIFYTVLFIEDERHK